MKEDNLPIVFQKYFLEKKFKEIVKEIDKEYKKENRYNGPFIELIAPGLYKIQTDRMKIHGGQGMIDEINKIMKEDFSL